MADVKQIQLQFPMIPEEDMNNSSAGGIGLSIPKAGSLVCVYSYDENYKKRAYLKIGDGSTSLKNLEYVNGERIIVNWGEIQNEVDALVKQETVDQIDEITSVYNKRLINLEHRLDDALFVTDDTTAYTKDVPSDVAPYAEINKIGGMTYRDPHDSDNLVPYPYLSRSNFGTEVEGYIIAEPNNADSTVYTITKGNGRTYAAGTYIFEVGENQSYQLDGVGVTFSNYGNTAPTVTRISNYKIQIVATASFSISEFTATLHWGGSGGSEAAKMYPMMYPESVPITWKPRVAPTLVNAKVTAIESEGANLIPFPYANTSKTENGITWTLNADGSVTANGTATAASYFNFMMNAPNVNSIIPYDMTLSGCPSGGGSNRYELQVWKRGATTQFQDFGSSVKIPKGAEYEQIYAVIRTGYTANNLTFKAMLNRGSVAFPYKPFVGTLDTFAIPEAVQSRKGYGLGVPNAVSNRIEFRDNGVFELNQCEEIVLDGVNVKFDTASTANGYRYFAITLPKVIYGISTLVSTDFEARYKMEPGYAYVAGNPRKQLLCYFIDQTMTTKEEANAYAAERYKSGNPIKFVVAYETAEESDITDLITPDNFIQVQGAGYITAVNEYKLAVSSEITYQCLGGA